MRISILTLFPEMFTGPFDLSIIARAKQKKIVDIKLVNLRNFSIDTYKSVDDHPYGGGVGMILRVDVVDRALLSIKEKHSGEQNWTVLLDPAGIPYTQDIAQTLSHIAHLILICGHYEGIDERIRSLVDQELSIGDYVLTGGEIPAMVVIDSITRLIPGVLKKTHATKDESFAHGLLEYPQYTRPMEYKGIHVPSVLSSGNHAAIKKWREQKSRERTIARRPDLLTEQMDLPSQDQ